MQTVMVIEGVVVELNVEDDGQAMWADVEDGSDGTNGAWVRLHSWCENGSDHPTLKPLEGKRLRVTVELVDG